MAKVISWEVTQYTNRECRVRVSVVADQLERLPEAIEYAMANGISMTFGLVQMCPASYAVDRNTIETTTYGDSEPSWIATGTLTIDVEGLVVP